MNEQLCHPWPERNKGPILDILVQYLFDGSRILEIAGGSGQHAVHFARKLPKTTWIPSDIAEENLASIRSWRNQENLENLEKPIKLDVCDPNWPISDIDAIFNANMIHIAPWHCCLALLAGARRHLEPGKLLILYGPFTIGGEHTAPSNEDFDKKLRVQDPNWGLRHLETVCEAADGFELIRRHPMPANNQTIILRRR